MEFFHSPYWKKLGDSTKGHLGQPLFVSSPGGEVFEATSLAKDLKKATLLGGGFKYFFMFIPTWGRWTHFDSYFKMGWFNHQPVLGGWFGRFFWVQQKIGIPIFWSFKFRECSTMVNL